MAGAYYYISLPVVMFLVIAVAGSIIYGFLLLGRVPVKLVVVLGLGAIITVFKMVQSLFIKTHSADPGRSLRREEAAALWRNAEAVAAGIGTRPIDEIRVTPGTEMAVYERGSRRERAQDRAQRVLLLGAGLINGFPQSAFRAVLAHEYGHFSHRDTAGGDIALRVNQDMIKFAVAMAENGQAVVQHCLPFPATLSLHQTGCDVD
ncbi:MAG TPA: M48 family metallopeptidase [Acidobacteriota bacterium]|nr:M48 family metallopeptidase [Acidobacteriota bacterium]